ncbi:SGNH/GDSL hydrolase family protein [Angustibacter sp. McL0619]|uniref:SGNH/GDSL hydrolase family protein n=1 Tax=Angustibacter sp. McL0619 TaxID=3415676 RepID=UPI003CF3E33E
MDDRASHPPPWTRYVAVGDSFTEGMEDRGPDGVYRGWADGLAHLLAAGRAAGRDRAGHEVEPLHYANLAVRGRLLDQIVREQVPGAIELGADLVSLVGGGNDVLRPGSDVDKLAARLEAAVVDLRLSGADVLLATPVDPVKSPLINLTRGKAAVFAAAIWTIARRHQAYVLDLWGMKALQDRRLWAADRIHLTTEGHQRVAAHAAQVLGLAGDGSWAVPLPPAAALDRRTALKQDAQWVRLYVGPWVGRRLRRRSSGDAIRPKRPQAEPLPLVDPPD